MVVVVFLLMAAPAHQIDRLKMSSASHFVSPGTLESPAACKTVLWVLTMLSRSAGACDPLARCCF